MVSESWLLGNFVIEKGHTVKLAKCELVMKRWQDREQHREQRDETCSVIREVVHVPSSTAYQLRQI